MKLTPVMKDFVVHWGEMGAKWGTNRTVAQLQAFLYISPEPLNADDIIDSLQIARSNVSSSLKELQNWKIVKVVHKFGDRRDHYELMKDVCAMFQTILDERKRREIDPTLQILKECISETDTKNKEDRYSRERLVELLNFIETMSLWYERMRKMSIDKIMGFVQLENKFSKFLKGSK